MSNGIATTRDEAAPHEATQVTIVRARYAGLDGLRAIAVTLVLIYHLFPGLLPGGFLGVDVFFAISGFLITSLLLSEWAGSGRIGLLNFWRRRARRLLPALGLVIVSSSAAALLVGGDVLVGIGRQIAGAALFVSNWTSIAAGSDYFAKDAPELFRNTWSLGIEEQFYLILPILALILFRLRGRAGRIARPIILGTLGLASAILMAVGSFAGDEPTRLYFGSDTHSFGLLLGAALACVLHRGLREGTPPDHTPRQWPLFLTAGLGFAVLLTLACTLREGSPESFRGGIQLATLASLGIIWAVTRPGMRFARHLDARPMRWLGERSYGIYLWHWPLLVLAQAVLGTLALTGWGWLGTGLGVLVMTLALSEISYRYIEQPVRRLGLIRSLQRMVRLGRGDGRQRTIAIVLSIFLVITVPATIAAISFAPKSTSAEDAIERGRELLAQRQADDAQSQSTDEQDPDSPAPELPGQAPQGIALPLGEGSPVIPAGTQLSAIGDSVMLASSPELSERFPGISIDAEVSRGFSVGVGLAEEQLAGGTLRHALIVGLGTNGPVDAADLDALRATAGSRPLVLVSAHADRDWIPGVNALLAEYAAAHRGVVLAPWDEAITPHPEMLAGDGIHPEPSGGQLYANAISQALEQLNEPSERVGFSGPRR